MNAHYFPMSLFDTADLFPNNDELNAFTKKVEQLYVNINTQGLKVDLEKLKRKRLGRTLKRVRQKTIPVHRIVTQLQRDCDIMRAIWGSPEHI